MDHSRMGLSCTEKRRCIAVYEYVAGHRVHSFFDQIPRLGYAQLACMAG